MTELPDHRADPADRAERLLATGTDRRRRARAALRGRGREGVGWENAAEPPF
ncbi:hypothetical protein [Kitasatospora phosalacinea]|uniref:Uncharacterized protein n=1 Tax=Kitasatospora phosalacinea TaxID=2065 RepID=A0A9W6PJ42_9ACTN|nr:hypothetical protein [Kitasatospora phosalacinea]GLW55772.1 hypothetical protein Kpho01_37830 [Kitasatospora phosalacinea]